jgi:hypothetical protein
MIDNQSWIADLNEHSEFCIPLQFFLNPLFGYWVMANIFWIHHSEFRRRLKENVTDTFDERVLLALADKQDIEKATIALAEMKDIVEDIIHEFIQI